MWLWLRGEDFLESAPEKLQTISRQHVLPPELRTRDKTRDTALKMLHAAARRMRKLGLWAGGVSVNIGYRFTAQ
jgi:DNA polymerase-4